MFLIDQKVTKVKNKAKKTLLKRQINKEKRRIKEKTIKRNEDALLALKKLEAKQTRKLIDTLVKQRDELNRKLKALENMIPNVKKRHGRRVTLDENKILELRHKGLSYQEISDRLYCSKSGVAKVIKKYNAK